jgi:hypothetical protein
MSNQALLEVNEDIIAAVVENLQIGRLADCFTHFSMLQENLAALAIEVDNYPSDQADPYDTLFSFPDEIMRKDVLDDLRPREAFVTQGDTALPHPCSKCTDNGVDAQVCRVQLQHTDPSSKLSVKEKDAYAAAARGLYARYQSLTNKLNCAGGIGGKAGAIKEEGGDGEAAAAAAAGAGAAAGLATIGRLNYQRWTPEDKFTLLLGLGLYGDSDNYHSKIAGILNNRSADQV